MQPVDQTTPRWWLVVAAVAMLTAAGWLLANQPDGRGTPAEPPMLQVAPGGEVDLVSLPHDQQELYLAAAADPEAFSHVACYCGCEAFLDHRNLLDCFVRPAGGWERHATGCGVCLSEARDVVEWRGEGLALDEIRDRIDQRYGAITDPAA